MTSDRGSSTILAAAVAGVIAVLSIATAGLGLAYSARAQAQVASDAAALAAAVATYPPASAGSPVSRAGSIAAANGAVLASCVCPVDATPRIRIVTVVTYVSVDPPLLGPLRIHATSRAEFDPDRWLGHPLS